MSALNLNFAPSPAPSPAAPAPEASVAAKPQQDDGKTAAASGADGEQAGSQPFATVLKQQMSQPADAGKAAGKAAAKAVTAGIGIVDAAAAAQAATAAATDAAATGPQDDALAYLAPMLAGLAPATKETAGVEAQGKDKDEKDDDPTLIAAPVTAEVVATATLPGKDEAAAETAKTLPTASTATTANLAAQTPVAAENAEQTGKSRSQAETGFDALLNASREASMAAANSSAGAHNHAAAASATAATPTAQVNTPVGARGWDNEVGEKIIWMANRNEGRAELVLNPPHLGRVEVSLSVNGDQANAMFVSANPAVREALENAVPRLREILQDAGISLGQTQVGAESFQQSANNRENGDNSRPGNGGGGTTDMRTAGVGSAGSGSPLQWAKRGNGLVDTFA